MHGDGGGCHGRSGASCMCRRRRTWCHIIAVVVAGFFKRKKERKKELLLLLTFLGIEGKMKIESGILMVGT